jgi:predicted dienelactone hydrolase
MKRLLAAAALSLFAQTVHAAEAPGFAELTIAAAHQAKPMEAGVWYPAAADSAAPTVFDHPIFYGVPAVQDAAVAPGKHPVVLLSHGLGGHFRALSWLAAGLAAKGAIVVGVNHPGSTARDFDMARGLHHWTRVADLQAALAQVLADPKLGPHTDPDRIYATGFSYGGWTALSIAGLKGDLTAYAQACDDAGARSTHCRDIAKAGIDLRSYDATAWDRSYKDARIRAVAAIDPGLTYGLTAERAKDLPSNVLLIGLGVGADRLMATDTSPAGSGFENAVPAARIKLIAPASHFTALLECKPAGAAILVEEHDDPVCTDPPSADRHAVHATIVESIATAFGLR